MKTQVLEINAMIHSVELYYNTHLNSIKHQSFHPGTFYSLVVYYHIMEHLNSTTIMVTSYVYRGPTHSNWSEYQ